MFIGWYLSDTMLHSGRRTESTPQTFVLCGTAFFSKIKATKKLNHLALKPICIPVRARQVQGFSPESKLCWKGKKISLCAATFVFVFTQPLYCKNEEDSFFPFIFFLTLLLSTAAEYTFILYSDILCQTSRGETPAEESLLIFLLSTTNAQVCILKSIVYLLGIT